METLKRYVLKSGETLQEIARRNKMTVDDLLRHNRHIRDRYRVLAGQVIYLPKMPQTDG